MHLIFLENLPLKTRVWAFPHLPRRIDVPYISTKPVTKGSCASACWGVIAACCPQASTQVPDSSHCETAVNPHGGGGSAKNHVRPVGDACVQAAGRISCDINISTSPQRSTHSTCTERTHVSHRLHLPGARPRISQSELMYAPVSGKLRNHQHS